MELQQSPSGDLLLDTSEDPPEWDPDELYAEKMGQLKKEIFEKAKTNVDEAQKKTNSTTTKSTPIQRYLCSLPLPLVSYNV